MADELSPAEMECLLQAVNTFVRQREGRIPTWVDRDWLQGELRVHLLARWRHYCRRRGAPTTWAWHLLERKLLNLLRDAGRRRAVWQTVSLSQPVAAAEELALEGALAAATLDPAVHLEQRLLATLAWQELCRLPRPEAQMLYLRFWCHWERRQVAAQFQIPYHRLGYLERRWLARLRQRVQAVGIA